METSRQCLPTLKMKNDRSRAHVVSITSCTHFPKDTFVNKQWTALKVVRMKSKDAHLRNSFAAFSIMMGFAAEIISNFMFSSTPQHTGIQLIVGNVRFQLTQVK